MKQCGCNPIPQPFEFPVTTCNCGLGIVQDLDIKEDCSSEFDNLCELKQKIINDFQDILNKLQCGIQPDLEFLLQEISLVYINTNENIVLFKSPGIA